MISKKIIKSPINYTGNKFQILEQILEQMDTEDKVIVDMCSGGATVGINITNAKKVYMIEKNKKITTLLEYLGTEKVERILENNNKLIEKYKLSNSNKYGTEKYKKYRNGNNGLKSFNECGYKLLREDYNRRKNKFSKSALQELYLLIIYGFNNEIRFNKLGDFNIPCGKTDFNINNYKKIVEYNDRYDGNMYEILNIDCFSKEALTIYEKSDIIYVDPPYLITTAGYNENQGWNEVMETKLLKLIEDLMISGKVIYLSNVMSSDGKENTILKNWCEKNKNHIKIFDIEKHYRSSSYNKIVRGKYREILIEVKSENK